MNKIQPKNRFFLLISIFGIIFGMISVNVSGEANLPQNAYSGVIGTQYWAYPVLPNMMSSPITGDFDVDGHIEIIFLMQDLSSTNYLTCIYAENYTLKWKTVQSYSMIWGPISAANLDEDPALELIFITNLQCIEVVNSINGTLKWRSPTNYGNLVSIGDIDQDNRTEIIATSGANGSINCFDGKGNIKFSTINVGAQFLSNNQMTLFDVDKDGQTEIIAVDSSARKVHVMSGKNGALKWSSIVFPGAPCISATPIDINHDQNTEILVGTNDGYLYALYGQNGSILWSKNVGYTLDSCNQFFRNFLMADVDSDSDYEIFFGSSLGKYFCLNSTGSIQWNFSTGNSQISMGCLVDFDSDRRFEVIFASGNIIYCLNAETGAEEWRFTNSDSYSDGIIEPCDVDLDGNLELIFGCYGSSKLICIIGTGDPWMIPGPVPLCGGSRFHTGSFLDDDQDMITNQLELTIGTNLTLSDTDSDQVIDSQEFFYRINPLSNDTDQDRMADGWELNNSFDPLNSADADLDADLDTVLNKWEFANGTNPHNSDSDADTMPDGWEIKYSLNPTNSSDTILDPDNDHFTNLQEYQANTNPQNPDTDGDFWPDGWDLAPLDALKPNLYVGGGFAVLIGIGVIRSKLRQTKSKSKVEKKIKRKK